MSLIMDNRIEQITTSAGWERELDKAHARLAQGDERAAASIRQAEKNVQVWRERGR